MKREYVCKKCGCNTTFMEQSGPPHWAVLFRMREMDNMAEQRRGKAN